MTVDPAPSLSTTFDGRTFYFCNPKSKRFDPAPQMYIGEEAPVPRQPTSGATYVCQMDLEVRESKLGHCPKCSMALEREQPQLLPQRTEWTWPMHPEIVRDRGVESRCRRMSRPASAAWSSMLFCAAKPIDASLQAVTQMESGSFRRLLHTGVASLR